MNERIRELQAEQEPVAWRQIGIGDCEGTTILTARLPIEYNTEWWKFEPLYAAPVRTKDLTELLDVMVRMANYIDKLGGDSKSFRAVIAADREKNK